MIYKDGKKIGALYRDGKAITKAFRDGKLVWQKDAEEVKLVKRIWASMPSIRSENYHYITASLWTIKDSTTNGYIDVDAKGTAFRAAGSGRKGKVGMETIKSGEDYSFYIDLPSAATMSEKDIAIGDSISISCKCASQSITGSVTANFKMYDITATDAQQAGVVYSSSTPFLPNTAVSYNYNITETMGSWLAPSLYDRVSISAQVEDELVFSPDSLIANNRYAWTKDGNITKPHSGSVSHTIPSSGFAAMISELNNISEWKPQMVFSFGSSNGTISNLKVTVPAFTKTISLKVTKIETY